MSEALTAATFKSKVFNYETQSDWKFEGDLPAIIDFQAEWCPPCKMVTPILESIEQEFQGRLRVYQVDTDAEQELVATFGITGMPTLLFIPKTGDPRVIRGAVPRNQILKAMKEVLEVG